MNRPVPIIAILSLLIVTTVMVVHAERMTKAQMGEPIVERLPIQCGSIAEKFLNGKDGLTPAEFYEMRGQITACVDRQKEAKK